MIENRIKVIRGSYDAFKNRESKGINRRKRNSLRGFRVRMKEITVQFIDDVTE